MKDTIFTDDFPFVNTNEELCEIKKKYSDYDEYYIASGCIEERRKKFDELWSYFEPLADRHFLSDCKKSFYQRTWEMYLGVVLKQNNFDLQSFNSGPDFVVNKGKSNELYIEAVACKKGDNLEKVPDMVLNVAQDIPESEMLLRIVNSLTSKNQKYKEFIKNKKKPYIIAVNSGELGYPENPNIPLILKCLFGIEFECFSKCNDELVYNGWSKRKFIEKKNNSPVTMECFNNKNFNSVSAVIYSSDAILNTPEEIGSELMLIHNPNCSYPLSIDTFAFLKQYKVSYDNSNLILHNLKESGVKVVDGRVYDGR